MAIWSDSIISAKAQEAEYEIARELQCIRTRISLATSIGEATIALPEYVMGVVRVTWKGTKLFPFSQKEMAQLFIQYMPEEDGAFLETSYYSSAFTTIVNRFPVGRPDKYIYDSNGMHSISLFPAPSESLSEYTTGLWDTNIENALILEVFRTPDLDGNTNRVPTYLRQRLVRAYVLKELFKIEGKGQDLEAAEYWKAKYATSLLRAKHILRGIYSSNSHSITTLSNRKILGTPQFPYSMGIQVR